MLRGGQFFALLGPIPSYLREQGRPLRASPSACFRSASSAGRTGLRPLLPDSPRGPMDLELSDGEGVEEIRPPKTKRKDDGGGGVPSPVKRGAADQEMVSMRAVLAEQTRDIKDGIKTDIQAAIHATETKFEEALEGVRAGIQGQVLLLEGELSPRRRQHGHPPRLFRHGRSSPHPAC